MVQLHDDDRLRRLDAVRQFMIWKAASGFMLATEIAQPHAIAVTAVTRTEVLGALQRINRAPLSFTEPEWLDREHLGEEVVSLLLPKVLNITLEELAAMRQAFVDGTMPGLSWRTPER